MGDDDAKQRVLEILDGRVGKANGITSRDINEIIEADDIGSFPSTRAIITDIIKTEDIPILASNNGYFIADTGEEVEDYIDTLNKRILGIVERRYAVNRAAAQWEGIDYESDDDIPEDDSDLL